MLEEYIARAQKADTDETRIDVLRTEGVLPSRGAKASRDALKALLFDLRQRGDHCARPGPRRFGARLGRSSPARRRAPVPRPARARPRRAPSRRRACGVSRGIRAHPHRRVPRHRSAAGRDRSAPRVVPPRHRVTRVVRRPAHACRCRPAVLRRRPEAVDLPVPSGRRRALSPRRKTCSPIRRCTSPRTSAPSPRSSTSSTPCSSPWMNDADAGAQPDYMALTAHVPDHDTSPTVVTIGDELAEPSHCRGPVSRSRRGRAGHRAGEARRVDGPRSGATSCARRGTPTSRC